MRKAADVHVVSSSVVAIWMHWSLAGTQVAVATSHAGSVQTMSPLSSELNPMTTKYTGSTVASAGRRSSSTVRSSRTSRSVEFQGHEYGSVGGVVVPPGSGGPTGGLSSQ